MANGDQVGDHSDGGDRSGDPEPPQRQSLPERVKSPVELVQPAQCTLAGS